MDGELILHTPLRWAYSFSTDHPLVNNRDYENIAEREVELKGV
jgi:hypothetical protein